MNERNLKIIEILKKNKTATIAELAKELGVTEITVRRDLEKMIDEKMVENKRGIIRLTNVTNGVLPLSMRLIINKDIKIKLAMYCASLIKDNQIVFLDAGSTLLEIFDYITSSNNVFVTGGLKVAVEAAKHGQRVYLLPGFVSPQNYSTLSNDAVDLMDKMTFDLALIGCSGISRFYKFATNSPETAALKSKAIEKSLKAYVVSDSSKYSTLGFSTFADFSDVTLISDKLPEEEYPDLKIIVPPSFEEE